MQRKLILLVEDNPNDEKLTLLALQKSHPETDIVVAHDGVEALDCLFRQNSPPGRDSTIKPAVVFLDMKLPRVDGLEVLQTIRGREQTRFLPVVILTSSVEEQDIIQGYRLGANSYVQKPICFTEFAEVVHQIGRYWLGLNQALPR